jgi:HPt (histidine-containing phosphotransfer) domain-containing protein
MRLLPGWVHTPIIAMTANTFDEDRAAYTQAGMNDLVGKPIDINVLSSTLLRWLSTRASAVLAQAQGAAPQSTSAEAVRQRLRGIAGLDVDNGLARIRGNVEGYLRVLRAFVSSHEKEVAQLTEALAQGNLAALQEVAHSLKGSGGNIGALRLADTATALAVALRQNAPPTQLKNYGTALLAELKAVLDSMRSALHGL